MNETRTTVGLASQCPAIGEADSPTESRSEAPWLANWGPGAIVTKLGGVASLDAIRTAIHEGKHVAGNQYRLAEALVPLSRANRWDLAKLEWALDEIYTSEEQETCFAGITQFAKSVS